jgi:hypothetical protein
MTQLPIRRVDLYKHGLGWFQREGRVDARELTLTFPRRAMDDVLKSLVVIDRDGSGVEGLSFETPPDRNNAVRRPPLAIAPAGAMLGVLTAFRGRRVELTLSDGRQLVGDLLGVEQSAGQPLLAGRVALLAEGGVLHFPELGELVGATLQDPTARADLDLLLRSARSDEEREQTTLRLGPGAHDLQLSYLAPAPAWRVSYRLLIEAVEGAGDPAAAQVLLQGWALFENTLDEDLEAIELSLLAGQPVSFRYPLHAPKTPERPLLDDDRPVDDDDDLHPPMAAAAAAPMMLMEGSTPYAAKRMDLGAVAASATPVAEGREQGVLFAYTVTTPVSVGRGQSAMVPLLSHRGPGRRLLHYRADRGERHPQAMVEFDNGALTLERGPVTVIDDGGYGGEGMLDYSPASATIRLGYALELGIRVDEEQVHAEERKTLLIRDGGLIQQHHALRDRIYRIVSQLPRAVALRIEADRWTYDSQFVTAADCRTPESVEAGVVQLTVAVPALARLELRTRERRLIAQRIEADGLNPQLLRNLLAAADSDGVVRQRLQTLLERADQIQQLEQQLAAHRQERKSLGERQKQLRENLAPLGAQGREGELRARLVDDLGRAQDALDAAERRESELSQQIATCRAEQRAALRA